MRKLVIIFMIFLMSMAWAVLSNAKPNCDKEASATVISLQGNVAFDPSTNGSWHEAQLNETLCEGDKIWVKPDSRMSLALPGNDVLRLNENTVLTLKIINLKQTSLLDVVKGFIHFISRKPKEVKIESGIANAAPLGTEFAFSVDDSKAALWVYEGGVKLYNQHGSVNLTSGQAAEALLGKAPQLRIDIKPQDAVNWTLYYPPLLPSSDSLKAADPTISKAIDDYRKGRIDLALQRLATVLPSQQNPHFHKVRGALRLIVGQVDLAQQDIKAVQATNANDAEALALQSVIALTQNRKDQAFELASKAVSSNPQSATAYTALSYAEQGRFNLEKAQVAANKAVQLAPQDAMALARKAELQLSQGLISDSEQSVQKAISLDANLERTQTIKGFTHLMSMDTDEAMQAFSKAITLDSTSPLARLGLGLAKIRDGELEEGRKELEIAANLDPNNSLIRSYLGKAYYEEKRSDRAEDQFKLAKERDPKDPTPYFYDAIRKQTINRPVEALLDMQQAIELNDNRGVYRSQLLLDKDTAARQVGLGRIYNNLGFDDPSNRQAMNSLAIDPSNYSAHRLLSDSYATKPRHEIARSSEHLQSQLLQPLNYNPIQPSLAYTDLNIIRGIGPNQTAFNEYNRMFERNGIRFTTTGIAGSNSTFGDETALSGIYNKLSYSLGQLHYETDGFRKNNDLKHNIYNAFAQYEITPALNIQAEFRHRETQHGDLVLNGNAEDFDTKYDRQLDQDTYRAGLKFSPSKQNDFLVSLIHANRTELVNNSFSSQDENGVTKDYIATQKVKKESSNLETQYLFHNEYANAVLGAGANHSDNVINISSNRPGSSCPCVNNYNTDQYFAYFYSNFKLKNHLTVTSGLSYDINTDNSRDVAQEDSGISVYRFNPKFGFLWKATKALSFRGAVFRSVKSAIVDNQLLQPTQIAGFNQFFDDFNGTIAWLYGIGMDAHPSRNIYTAIEAYRRELKTPSSTTTFDKSREELYRLYFNWLPTQYLALNSEFRFEYFRGLIGDYPNYVETLYFPLELRFFEPTGFFASIKGTYVNQRLEDIALGGNSNSNFYLLDAAIGYRFPKQYGLVSFEAKNIFDSNFVYLDRHFQMNERRTPDFYPERMLFARLTLNF